MSDELDKLMASTRRMSKWMLAAYTAIVAVLVYMDVAHGLTLVVAPILIAWSFALWSVGHLNGWWGRTR